MGAKNKNLSYLHTISLSCNRQTQHKHNGHLEENQQPVIDSLIAKFSNDPPTIKKTPENHDPLANYSEGSLDEDAELVSETLAMIYAEQGYSGKAIKMLKKLSLIYPEKSSIFASQIEKIKIEKNNNQIN